jgi:hypothetical protein
MPPGKTTFAVKCNNNNKSYKIKKSYELFLKISVTYHGREAPSRETNAEGKLTHSYGKV